MERLPMERERCPGLGREIRRLLALVIREEDEARGLDPAQQHDPCVRRSIRPYRCEHHGIRKRQLRRHRRVEPGPELDGRVVVAIRRVEALSFVFAAQGAGVHRRVVSWKWRTGPRWSTVGIVLGASIVLSVLGGCSGRDDSGGPSVDDSDTPTETMGTVTKNGITV